MTSSPSDLKHRILAQLEAGISAPDLAASHGIDPSLIWGWVGAERAKRAPKRELKGLPKRSHFNREPRPILIQPDDVQIVTFVHEGRFRSIDDICKHMRHRHPKKIKERVGELFHCAYLDRPAGQRDYYRANAARPSYVYALGPRGAELLAEVLQIQMPKTDWLRANREINRPNIFHQLLISSTITAFKDALKDRTDIRFITPEEILSRAPAATRERANPWKLKAKVPTSKGLLVDLAAVPDAAWGIDFLQKRIRYWYFLEADKGSMPVWRSTLLGRTSMYGKFLAYQHSQIAGYPARALNIQNFRVLTVTTGPQRLANMIELIKDKENNITRPNMFLFADTATLQNAGNVLDVTWLTGKGERVRLTD
jgi:hypothetical protein